MSQPNQKIGLAILAIGWLALLALSLSPVVGRAAEDNSRFFSETNHTVSGKFLDYWNTNGSLATFGFPITDAEPETDPETGKTFLTQWFQRNRFELHPENAGTNYEVLLGLLGKDLRRTALKLDPDFTQAQPLPDSLFFKETQHNLGSYFAAYWTNQGGLERFGYPISELKAALDPQTGQVFKTQWFERARFEYHPENDKPYDVLLGLLGNQIKTPKGPVEFAWHYLLSGAPNAIARDPRPASNLLYVADRDNSQVLVYNQNMELQRRVGEPGNANGQFTNPQAVQVDRQGFVYVVDGPRDNLPDQNYRVQKFDPNGNFLLAFGGYGSEPGQFRTPRSLAISPTGAIYVADATKGVQIFDSSGNFSGYLAPTGLADGQLQQPTGLAIDGNGNTYLSENLQEIPNSSGGNRVSLFDVNGVYKGRLSFPKNDFIQALTTGSNNTLYVATSKGIYTYNPGDPKARLLFKTGDKEVAGLVNMPTGLAVDAAYNLYIADAGCNCLQKFTQPG